MKLICKSDVPVVHLFEERFSSFFEDVNKTIYFVPIDCFPFDGGTYNSPFELLGNCIGYSENKWRELDLTEDEILAMIAHEIGHLLDEKRWSTEGVAHEAPADQMAVNLGLKEAMISGLEKLIKSGLYNNEHLEERIRILRNKK